MSDLQKKYGGLLNKKDQAETSATNKKLVLDFLYGEPYVTVDVIQELVGYKTRAGTMRFLKTFAKGGLIKYQISELADSRKIPLVGITTRGCYAIYNSEKHIKLRTKSANLKNISGFTFNHLKQIQLLKTLIIKSERWTIHELDHSKWKKNKPDIICTLQKSDEKIIHAFEIELTIKSVARYKKILNIYQSQIKNKLCDAVFWISDTETKVKKLKNIIYSFDEKLYSNNYVYLLSNLDN